MKFKITTLIVLSIFFITGKVERKHHLNHSQTIYQEMRNLKIRTRKAEFKRTRKLNTTFNPIDMTLKDWRTSTEPDHIRVIALYIHWNNSHSYGLTSESVDADLEEAFELMERSSANLVQFDYNICEQEADFEMPATHREASEMAIQICAPIVDFYDYDWVLVLPLNLGGAKGVYVGLQPILVEPDGEVALELPVIKFAGPPFESKIVIHEGGHALGLSHSSSIHCSHNSFSVREECTFVEYAEAFDIMGRGVATDEYNCAYKEELGWLRSPENIIRSWSGRSHTITNYTQFSSNPQCIRLNVEPSFRDMEVPEGRPNDPCQKLYIEYREEAEGALVRCKTNQNREWTTLIDCSPGSDDTSVLGVGETCRTGLGFDIIFEDQYNDKAKISIREAPRLYPADILMRNWPWSWL